MNAAAAGKVYPEAPFTVHPGRVAAFRRVFSQVEGVPVTFATAAEFTAIPGIVADPEVAIDFSGSSTGLRSTSSGARCGRERRWRSGAGSSRSARSEPTPSWCSSPSSWNPAARSSVRRGRRRSNGPQTDAVASPGRSGSEPDPLAHRDRRGREGVRGRRRRREPAPPGRGRCPRRGVLVIVAHGMFTMGHLAACIAEWAGGPSGCGDSRHSSAHLSSWVRRSWQVGA